MGFRKSLGCSQSGVPRSACPPAAAAWGTAFRAARAKARAQGGLLGKPHSTPPCSMPQSWPVGQGECLRAVEKEIRANSGPSPGWGVLRGSLASPGQKLRVCPLLSPPRWASALRDTARPDRKSAWELSAFPVPKRGVGGSDHDWSRVSAESGADSAPWSEGLCQAEGWGDRDPTQGGAQELAF